MVPIFASALLGLFASVSFPQGSPPPPPMPWGPLGGSASSVAVDPTNPSVLLVIKATKGLFRSTDAGVTFDKFGTNLPTDIRDLTYDPSNPSGLYVLNGKQIRRSLDFGATWSLLPFVATGSLNSLAISPSGSHLMATDAFNVYRSLDGGLNWTISLSVVPFAGEVIEDVVIAPSNPTIVYASSNKGVYRSVDSGGSFVKAGPFSSWTQALTVSPVNPSIVFAGTASNGVFRSLDAGATFVQVGTGLAATGNAEFFLWSPDGSTLWYAVLTGITKTTDLGVTWQTENAGLPANNLPIPLSMTYDSTGNVYLGVEGGGFNDQSGGGLYWRPVGTDAWVHIGFLESWINDVTVAAPSGKRVIAMGGGMYAADPLNVVVPTVWHSDFGADLRCVATDPNDPDRWVGGGVGAFIDNAQIVVVTQNGTQFAKTYERFGAGFVSAMAFDPFTPGRIVAGCYPAGFGNKAILVSSNSGASWTEIAGTEGWATRSIAFDPLRPGRVYQLSENNQWAASLNSGLTWSALQPAWPATGPGVFLAFDPFVQGRLYRGDAGSGLWRSDNGGATWQNLGVPLHNASGIAVNPDVPGMLWVSDAAGKIRVSTDFGSSSSEIWDVHLDAKGTRLALDRGTGSLLVGTDGASLWEIPGASPVVAYGTGTPGCQGTQSLRVNQFPKIGSGSFAISSGASPPFSLGLGLVTDWPDATGSDPFAIGVKLHVDLFAATEVLTLDFPSDGQGNGTAAAPIPASPALVHRTYYAQTLWGWSSCSLPPFQLSTSRGLAITIQP